MVTSRGLSAGYSPDLVSLRHLLWVDTPEFVFYRVLPTELLEISLHCPTQVFYSPTEESLPLARMRSESTVVRSVCLNISLLHPMFVRLTNDTTYLTANEGQKCRAVSLKLLRCKARARKSQYAISGTAHAFTYAWASQCAEGCAFHCLAFALLWQPVIDVLLYGLACFVLLTSSCISSKVLTIYIISRTDCCE